MKFYTNVQTLGNSLYVRAVAASGSKNFDRIGDFHPRIWIPSPASQIGDARFHTLQGYPVTEFDAGDIKETKEFIIANKGVNNFSIYGDIQPQYQYISKEFTEKIPYDLEKILVAYIDIETGCENGFPDIDSANEEIVAICLKLSNQENKFVFGCGEFTEEIPGGIYIKCENEMDLLNKFISAWKEDYPDIVSGWYIKFFDIPYLVNRIKKLFGENKAKQLSPWKILKEVSINTQGKDKQSYSLFGISILDYVDLYKKFTYSMQESYKLDHIAFVELGKNKLDYSEHGNLHLLYKLDYNKFIRYNAIDVDLVVALENKMKLIELAMTMAYDAKVNFEDVFGQLRMWDVIIYNYLLERKIVIPERSNDFKKEIVGGYVKEPKPGRYKWVVAGDLTSLYPHLIMEYNISPDTIINESMHIKDIEDLIYKKLDLSFLQEKGITMSATGQFFSKEKAGFVPELMEWMFNQRSSYKKQMIDAEKLLEEIKEEMVVRGICVDSNNMSNVG